MPQRSVIAHEDGYVVGVDFGTLSGRAVVVRVGDGAVLGSAVHDYAHGVTDAPAVGSAIHAAVAAGAYPDVRDAAAAMGRRDVAVYEPDEKRAAGYDALYRHDVTLHDHFGRGGNDVMHDLRRIRREAGTR
jgi:ribulose kinase